MKIAVCDDEKRILSYLGEKIKDAFLKQKCGADIQEFCDSREFAQSLESVFYDVIFLDIDMPGLNGFEVGRILRKSAHESMIIFVSNKEEYVFDSFQLDPFRFIRKSFFEQEIQEAVRALIAALEFSRKTITITSGTQQIRIFPNKISYVECNDKILKLVSQTGVTQFRYKMSDLEEQLKEFGFIRIHKGYLVNFQYISSIRNYQNNYEMVLDSGEMLPISRRRVKEVFEQFGRLVE